ncbi:MAG: phosphate ABC transporter permease PstA [Ruminococcus sp.]|nr:phosphate ABC transporter permease PstA [Ruminococcus sp.]
MSEKIKTYKTHPFSLVYNIITKISVTFTIGIFMLIVGYIIIKGVPNLKLSLFEKEYNTDNVSMMPAIFNTLEMLAIALAIAAPLGIFCAIYLVEYAKKGNRFVKLIRLTTETLSGIPSIVYGLFGNMFFVIALKWKLSMLSGGCTLAIMVLPLIIRSTEEALRSVDDSFREGSYGLGAGKLRTIFKVVIPPSISGIFSGIILAMGRIFGETAALIYTAGTIAKYAGPGDSGRTLAVHMYALSDNGLYMNEASAAAVILLIAVLLLNGLASLIAGRISEQ